MPYADDFDVNSKIKHMGDFIKEIESKLKQVERISDQRITSLEKRLACNRQISLHKVAECTQLET